MSANVIKKIKLPNGTTYDLPEGSPIFEGDKSDWGALSAQEKAKYAESNNGIVILKDDYEAQVELDDTKTTTTNVWSASKVNSMLPVWTSGVQALTSATSCTITNDAISSTSILEPYADNGTGEALPMPTISVSSHTATLTFDALEHDTTWYLKVTNLS